MKKFLTLPFILFIVWHPYAIAQTSIYTYTGAVQTYTVPPGVISITVDARGGDGGANYYYYAGTYYPTYRSRGGYGARVVCSLAVTPGQVLYTYVGGNGDSSNIEDYYYYYMGTYYDSGLGGWNGGGNGGDDSDYYSTYYYYGYGGGGGGGASDIRIGGTALTNRVIVAGGGGGGAWDCSGVNAERGGDGGGLTGETGYWCSANTNALVCGGGGTPSAGGPGATDYSCGTNSGTLGIGGSADTCYSIYYDDEGGGGGGGGYYGGGAGEWGGGGGGSSYTDSTRTTAVVHTRGYNTTLADSIIITVNCSAGAINGVTSICTGFTTSLTDTVSGSHSWSSSNTAVATIGATGIVTGLSAGTTTITYSVMAFCGSVYSIAVVTVNPLPAAITGLTSVCLGVSTALFDAATGGSWSSGSAGIASVVSSTGMTYGAGLGTSAITYTLPTGCIATTAVTVTALSTPITGTGIMCGGATIVLSDATSGGTWSSGSASIASVNLTSGLVTGGGVSAVGTATITYTATGGCTVLKVVTVDPQPGVITGASSVCSGATVSLFDGGGGSWSSSNTSIATIGLTSGIVTGLGSGTVVITYTLGAGCNTTAAISVSPSPLPILGATSLCIAATDTLTDATPGGIWTSTNTTVAVIDPFFGTVTAGLATGTAAISYTLSVGGCSASTSVTVNVGPLPIGGSPSLCSGATTGLSDGIAGGSWSSGSTGVATVDLSGNVYGVSAGTTTIFYTIGSCSVTEVVTVNPMPSPITGVTELCVGLATLISDASTGGSWSSSNAHIASVVPASGILTGGSAGTATISYTLSTGCTATITITINTGPPVITGVTHVCPGATTTLVDAGGGSWSSGNTAVATVGSAGTVSGVAPGTASVGYSIGAGCTTSITVTVNPLPASIGGITAVCSGSTTALSDGVGTWSSGNPAVASIVSASGVVTGTGTGTATITYTASATGCTAHTTVTVNALPSAITGTFLACPGATTSLNDMTTGGVWSSGNTTIATINATGTVTGMAPGTAVIAYTSVTGCAAHVTVTINPLPLAITGTLSICAGATTTLADATTGGLWATGSTGSIGTVAATSGIVRGVSAGTTVVSYTLTTGCARTTTVTVNPLPSAITGPSAECVGATITEAESLAGGTWSSSVATVATVVPIPTGSDVTGATTGTSVVTYTSAAGCIATTTITVSLSPTGIIGSPTVCAGDTTTLSDAIAGGVWSSSNISAATVGSLSGTITGVATGTTIVTYSLGTGCTVTTIMSVNASPSVITGGMSLCIGATTVLADATTGGAWSSSPASSGIAAVSGTGMVTGISAGTGAITYTHGGCSANAVITVNPTPTAIAGTPGICAGTSTVLGDGIGGGVWASSNTMIASVSSGVVSGISPGTATVTYSLGAGCAVTKNITVNPISAITGSLGICLGATTALSEATAGGAWSSGTTTMATVNITGVVTGVLSGTSMITYVTTAGCSATAVVTVNLAPSSISGPLSVCAGVTTALGNTAGGGAWTSGNTTVATVGSTGIVTGVISGTTIITYSLGSGCTVGATVTVNAGAAAITGTASICVGTTSLLSDATTSGTWSSSPATIASVTVGGVVTGVTSGTANVTYTPATGCAAVIAVTVNSAPAPITGTPNVCAGLTTTLNSTTPGGSWSSGSTGIATADPVLGIITGVMPGTAVITYVLPAGCSTNTTVTINSAPPPVSGSMGICIFSSTVLADPLGGGIWSSSNSDIATISPSGVVTGIALGTSTINYTVGGCSATSVVIINSLPDAIGGTSLCIGSTETLTDLPDGGTWSSADAGIATVDETGGIVTGISAGTTTIAYSLGAGCTVTAPVIVHALPGAITGIPEVCLGYVTILIDASGGGAWSSSNTALATVSGTGGVTGVSGGPVIISYTSISTSCAATRLVTVVAVPAITGVSDMCAFSRVMTVSDSLVGGTWTSTSVTVSTAGVVTPYSAGAASITYTIPLGCYTITSFTVHPLPGPVTGDFHFCVGMSAALGDTTAGGLWSSSNTAIASISPVGLVRGLSGGTATVSYVLSTGCMETETIIVDSEAVAGTITGLPVVCVGAVIGLFDLAAGGAWSSSNASADVLGGVVSGISAGVDTIKYTVSNSCSSATATKTIVVNPLPEAGTVSGPVTVCVDDSIVLFDAIPGGVWSSSAAVITGGIVHGIATGTDTIRYSVTNSCGTAVAVKTVTVNTLPDAGTVSLLDTLCTGFTFLLTDSIPGGAWSSSNSSSLSISATGLISALSEGVDTITYSLTNICGTTGASATITVKVASGPATITGYTFVCEGGADTLTVTPQGGVWGSSNSNVTIAPTATGAIISGMLPGADTITYIMPGECSGAGGIYPIVVLSVNQCDSNTGTRSLSKGDNVLRVWPDPNDGVFMLRLMANTDEPVQITITNLVGEKVKELTTATNKPTEVKLNYASGVYFISASTTFGSYVAKVVVRE